MDNCPCGWLFAKLDRLRQLEHVGARYIGVSGAVYCSVHCAEEHDDAHAEVMAGWFSPAVCS